MATIKEMADTQYPFKFSGSKSIFDKKRTEGFIDGANAVLEEIESVVQDIIDFDEGIIDSDSHSYDKNIYQIWNMLLQLKGE